MNCDYMHANISQLQQRLEVQSQELIKEIEMRRATEAALKESEVRYRALYDEDALRVERDNLKNIFEAMEDGVYIVTQEYDIQYVNPVLIKDFGAYETRKCYEYFHDRTEVCPWCKATDVFAGKTVRWQWHSLKNQRDYDLIDSPLLNPDGTISKLEIFRDITEFKKLEAQLLQSQKMESIGNLAGGIAHDFNNILTSIYGYSKMALENLDEGSDAWHDVQEILDSGEQAANLTKQLLAFSRSQKILPKAVSINSLLETMGKMLGRLIGEDIRLETSLDAQVGKIFADPGQLNQIIVNVVVNARDALRNHPEVDNKVIKLSTSEVFLGKDFSLRPEGSASAPHLLLEFSDNGCGMSKEVSGHIFEPFYTTKAVGKGTGMGLATVYGIVKQNNATIDVFSKLGSGTTFKIYWPIIDESSGDDREAGVSTELSSGGSEVVLFAEDNDKIREVVSRKLRQKGYEVIVAVDGLAALEKAKNHNGSIDLLFTDVVMPVMGGKELSEKIKEIYPDVAILFASGYLDDSIHNDILVRGDLINKPYRFSEIFSRMRQLLDK